VALALVGTMLMAGYFAAQADLAQGRATVRVAQLDAGAAALTSILPSTWDSAARFSQPIGSTQPISTAATLDHFVTRGWVSRISRTTYRVTVLVRDAADSSLSSRAVVLLHVRGPAIRDSFAEDLTGDPLAGISPAELRARAGLVLPAGSALEAPTCNICLGAGPLELTGGTGRGLLVVEGALRITGPVTWQGAIFATGGVEIESPGVLVVGALLSGRRISAKSISHLTLRADSALLAAVSWHAGSAEFPGARWWWPAP
jgi:hypothetical protein